jgi:hypothetical protein
MTTVKSILDSLSAQNALVSSATQKMLLGRNALVSSATQKMILEQNAALVQATRTLEQTSALWRDSLIRTPDLAVTNAVAKMITDFTVQTAFPSTAAAQMVAQFGEAQRSLTDQLVRFPGVELAALTSASNWMSRMRDASQRQKKYTEALLTLDWFVPPSMPVTRFWAAGAAATKGDEIGVCEVMFELCRVGLRNMVDEWMEQPAFKARRRIILDAVRDHRGRRFRVSVPTLLPLLEGIAFEEFAPGQYKKPQDIVEEAVRAYNPAEAEAILSAVFLIYGHVGFASLPSDSTRLNRHAVLHGRTLAYGTEKNSANVFFALDLLHSLVETKSDAAAA